MRTKFIILGVQLFALCGGTLFCRAELFMPGAWLTDIGGEYITESWTLPGRLNGDGATFDVTVDTTNPSMPILQAVPNSGTIGIGHAWYETTLDSVVDFSFTTNTTPFYYVNIAGEILMTPNQSFYIAFKLEKGSAEKGSA